MPKVLRVTGNGKANRAIENLTRGLMVASSKSLPRARPFQEPGGLGDSHVHNNVGIEIPGGLEETTEQSARPTTPDSQAPDERRKNPRPHAERSLIMMPDAAGERAVKHFAQRLDQQNRGCVSSPAVQLRTRRARRRGPGLSL